MGVRLASPGPPPRLRERALAACALLCDPCPRSLPEESACGSTRRVAWHSLRRHATYRAASAAGAFTNTIFDFIRAYILLALWTTNPTLGGYDPVDAVTFCFIGQALIGPVGIFSPTVSAELTDRIRSGDVAIDLHRPADFQAWWLATDVGRAGHALAFRGVPRLPSARCSSS